MPENSNFPQGNVGGINPTTPRFSQEKPGVSQQSGGTGSVLGKASELASSVAEKTRETMSSAARRAEEMASDAGHRIGNAATSAWETGTGYVTQRGLSGMGEDLTHFVRRNPLPALLISFCLGFAVARAFKE